LIPLVAALGVLGLIVGSFLNVVIWRVPRGVSVVSPPSACPSCGHPVRPYDNIPVLSWLLLRGRCRDCKAPISPRYPLVELGTGLLFALVGWFFLPPLLEAASTGPALAIAAAVLQLVAFLYLAAISVALALIDIDVKRLPNAIVLPGYAVGVVLFSIQALLMGSWPALLTAAIGMAGWFLVFFVPAFLLPGSMGLGDVKFAGVLGLFLGWLGWPQLVVGLLAGFIVGGLFGVALIIAGRGRKHRVAYGPWMILGAWVGILLGQPLTNWYLGFFGLS